MSQRREFLKTASLLTSGIALTSIANKLAGCSPRVSSSAVQNSFGLQLYTLRDVLPKDPQGVIRQVASFGYKQIESYEGPKGMFWGMKNTEFKKFVNDLGMDIVSSHCAWKEDFERKAGQAAEIGMKYLFCPFLGKNKELDFYKKAAEQFNKNGEIARKAGIKFGYHNHDYSFLPVEGQLPQDVMMQNTNPDTVDYEMDIYWVVAAGQDPVQWFNKYPNRFRACHVKDKKGSESTVVGTGTIDFPKILREGQKKGLQYYIVEQEAYAGTTPIDAVRANAEYMKKIKL
ncbi:MAG TPA: sugar phosphate isomerase/epimerase [Chitinophagaceae bacterium]|jgi:sugar phosphate isomerase/epimerase|nr:sugar phosphate isomerase/epimerase [Chitinophagaceae bacterium]